MSIGLDVSVAAILSSTVGAVFVPAGLVLGNGVEVEVEGPVDSNGILQAIKVEARGGNVELEASVQGVSVANGTITLQYVGGTVTVRTRAEEVAGPVPSVLLLNKADLLDEWQLSAEKAREVVGESCPVLQSSAKTGDGVEVAFADIARRMVGG